MYKKLKHAIKKSLACICMATITLTAVPADSLGNYSPTIQAEAAEPVYVVENLQAELGISKSFDELIKENSNIIIPNPTEHQKASQGFLDKYDKAIVFDQETNCLYYASGSKTASSNITFRTAGYELKFKIGDKSYSVDALRRPNEQRENDPFRTGSEFYLKDVTEFVNTSDGKTYNLFRIEMKDLNTAFDARGLDFSSIFYSSRSSLKVTGDAYLIKCVNGIQQAYLKDKEGNGVAETKSGTIAHTPSEAAADYVRYLII